MWPVPGPDLRASTLSFLTDYLKIDAEYVSSIPPFTVQRFRTPRSKVDTEVLVAFDCPNTRDFVKASAGNLAGRGVSAGLKIHIPQHLKANFRHLDNLCFNLKKIHADLRGSIKYDNEALDLVADFKLNDDAPWQRVAPSQAKDAKSTSGPSPSSGPSTVSATDLSALLSRGSETPSAGT